MKKILMLSALALAVTAAPAFAQGGGGGPKGPRDPGKMMFEKGDANGDGVIDESEFMEKAQERFKAMDTNDDGKVTKEEAQAHHQEVREKFRDRMQEKGRGPGGPAPDDEGAE